MAVVMRVHFNVSGEPTPEIDPVRSFLSEVPLGTDYAWLQPRKYRCTFRFQLVEVRPSRAPRPRTRPRQPSTPQPVGEPLELPMTMPTSEERWEIGLVQNVLAREEEFTYGSTVENTLTSQRRLCDTAASAEYRPFPYNWPDPAPTFGPSIQIPGVPTPRAPCARRLYAYPNGQLTPTQARPPYRPQQGSILSDSYTVDFTDEPDVLVPMVCSGNGMCNRARMVQVSQIFFVLRRAAGPYEPLLASVPFSVGVDARFSFQQRRGMRFSGGFNFGVAGHLSLATMPQNEPTNASSITISGPAELREQLGVDATLETQGQANEQHGIQRREHSCYQQFLSRLDEVGGILPPL